MKTPKFLETNKSTKERLKELDFIGPIFFMPAVCCLLLALQWGGTVYAWNSPIIIGLFCAFVVIFPIWVWTQFKLGERATIPIRIIKQRTVFFSSMYSLFFGAFTIICFYLPLYFQAVKGSSATKSGIQTLPLIGAVTVSAIVGSVLLSIVGYITPFMFGGAIVFAIGLGLLMMLDPDTPAAKWACYQIVAGIGAGMNLQV
jgi:MFS family permease